MEVGLSDNSLAVKTSRTALGRRTVRKGDTVAIDTPYLNGIADVIDGPSTEHGTKVHPKFLFRFQSGVIVDAAASYAGDLTEADELWLEDVPRFISIVGVDDQNISLF